MRAKDKQRQEVSKIHQEIPLAMLVGWGVYNWAPNCMLVAHWATIWAKVLGLHSGNHVI